MSRYEKIFELEDGRKINLQELLTRSILFDQCVHLLAHEDLTLLKKILEAEIIDITGQIADGIAQDRIEKTRNVLRIRKKQVSIVDGYFTAARNNLKRRIRQVTAERDAAINTANRLKKHIKGLEEDDFLKLFHRACIKFLPEAQYEEILSKAAITTKVKSAA
jgi:hypothetical protein